MLPFDSPDSPVDPLRSLVDAIREGDDGALAELVRRTQPVVWRLCAALGAPEDPDDLAQETYVRALRSLHGFRGESPVQWWLLAIARNVCADAVRRMQRQRRLVDRLQRFIEPTASAPVGDGTLDDLVARLEPTRREAFVLTQQVGLSYEEAATIVGCPVGTIRSRVARARTELLHAVRSAEVG